MPMSQHATIKRSKNILKTEKEPADRNPIIDGGKTTNKVSAKRASLIPFNLFLILTPKL